jgi:hypothetical protein
MQLKELGIESTSCNVSVCDNPQYRDSFPISPKTIALAITVANNVTNRATVDKMVNQLNAFMNVTNVKFEIFYYKSVTFTDYGNCLPVNNDDEKLFYPALRELKNKFNFLPAKYLNIYIACLKVGGTLNGIGTFPWTPSAKTAQGGLWLNSKLLDLTKASTLQHELGHCFGLWHTFHGVEKSESPDECNICYEFPHPRGDYENNFVGDLCSDTLPTSKNGKCMNPVDETCDSKSWGNTDWNNIMGYSQVDAQGKPKLCRTQYTKQQISRMHCYISKYLSSWIL